MSIRQRAVRGGAVLVVRQAIGMVLSVCGLFMITRLVGPHDYGLYAASAGLVTYLSNFGPWGIDVFLLRDKQEPTKEHYEVAISLLLLISVTLSATVALASPWITAFMHLPAAGPMLATLCLGLVPAILSVAASAKLGRELEFKKIAFNELSGQAAFLLVALPLAFKGLKAWAPVAGWVAQQWTLLVASYLTSKLRCGLGWNTKLAKYMLSSGLTYSSSVWVWQLRSLINPLIVGRLAGAEAVAFVSLAVRVTDMLSFAKTATWRVALAAFGKIQHDPVKLRQSVTEGMRLQAIAVGVPLVGFGLVAPYIMPWLFGMKWMPVLTIFPFVAVSYLSNAMFNMQSSVLYVLHHNMKVTYFHIVHVLLFATGAAVFIHTFGYIGYGWGEVVGLSAYALLHHFYRSVTGGSPEYTGAAIWYFVAVCSLVLAALGAPWLYLGFLLPLFPLALQSQREFIAHYVHLFRGPSNAT